MTWNDLGIRGGWLKERLEKHSEILFGLAQRRTHTNHMQSNFNLIPGTSRLAGQSKAELRSRRRKENEPDGILVPYLDCTWNCPNHRKHSESFFIFLSLEKTFRQQIQKDSTSLQENKPIEFLLRDTTKSFPKSPSH